jgi:cystathionine gamma-synthase/methionine-gamma-lyase
MTKYINGHGDSLGGCVLGSHELINQIKEFAMVNLGGILSPFNAWMIARGLCTLPLRMKQHSDVAMKVAEFLEQNPATRFVWYPGLKSHPNHDRALKYMANGEYSGMLSFDLNGTDEQKMKFLDNLHLITHAVSLGDIESLIVYNDKNGDKMPHYPKLFQPGFFRFSVGLESADDIIADIQQAMEAAGIR